jgi:hypothetical protein
MQPKQAKPCTAAAPAAAVVAAEAAAGVAEDDILAAVLAAVPADPAIGVAVANYAAFHRLSIDDVTIEQVRSTFTVFPSSAPPTRNGLQHQVGMRPRVLHVHAGVGRRTNNSL